MYNANDLLYKYEYIVVVTFIMWTDPAHSKSQKPLPKTKTKTRTKTIPDTKGPICGLIAKDV